MMKILLTAMSESENNMINLALFKQQLSLMIDGVDKELIVNVLVEKDMSNMVQLMAHLRAARDRVSTIMFDEGEPT